MGLKDLISLMSRIQNAHRRSPRKSMAKPLKIRKISPDDRLEKAARRILRTRIKEFYSCWPDPDRMPAPKQLHDLRISGKRLRYSAESLREFYPDRLALLLGVLKGAQDL